MISWLFEIDTLRLSTKDVTWSTVDYSGLIIADSFSGITMRWNIAGNGLIAPNEMTFDVSNSGGTYSIGDFEGEFCTVRLIEDDSNTRTWKFKIERAISYYGKITCYCVDFLQEHLVGDYPNTKSPKEIWPSSDAEGSDDYCVPVILGTAYIPVRSVNTATDRFYVLGESGPTYTVHEVASPHAWPNSSTWSAASYAMTGSTNSGYQLLQPIIADSDGDGNADASGLWRSGDTFYDMLCRFERNDTATITNPADCTEYVLEDFGVASADIDAASFSAAATAYGTVGFDSCGWWRKEPRERVLSNLLAQTDSFLKCTDKVELYQFSADPVETITDALLLSFSPSKVTKSKNDSGRVHWPESASKPSDVLNGKAVVPTHSGGTENTPSSEVLECRFLADSIAAQKAGILYFQKKFEQSQRINFSVTFSTLTTKATLTPGQVVTVDNTLYGGTNNVIITDMTINPDMRVDFTGVVLNYLEDWGDLTTTTKDVVTDTSLGFQLATTDYNGDLDVEAGADWETNLLNIPARFSETATTGINVTDSYMGYWDGSWQVFIQNNGNVQFGDPTTGQGFTWNQGTGVCTIQGALAIVSGSSGFSNLSDKPTALSDINSTEGTKLTGVESGADVTGTHTSYDTARVDGTAASTVKTNAADGATFTNLDAGDVAYLDSITGTYIANGAITTAKLYAGAVTAAKIATGTITATQIAAGTITAAKINVANLFAQTISVSGSMRFPGSSNFLYFGTTASSDTYLNYTTASTYRAVQLRSNNSYFLVNAGASVRTTMLSQASAAISAVNDIVLGVGSGKKIMFQGNGTTNVEITPANFPIIIPSGDYNGRIGNISRRWKYGYFQAIYRNGTWLDVEDDLYELSKIKKLTRNIADKQETVKDRESNFPLVDPLSLPLEFTNKPDVVLKLKQDNCDLITDTDIEEWLQDYDEAGWMLQLNVGLMSDLTTGAVRQLDTDVIAMFELLSSRITALETANKGIQNV